MQWPGDKHVTIIPCFSKNTHFQKNRDFLTSNLKSTVVKLMLSFLHWATFIRSMHLWVEPLKKLQTPFCQCQAAYDSRSVASRSLNSICPTSAHVIVLISVEHTAWPSWSNEGSVGLRSGQLADHRSLLTASQTLEVVSEELCSVGASGVILEDRVWPFIFRIVYKIYTQYIRVCTTS